MAKRQNEPRIIFKRGDFFGFFNLVNYRFLVLKFYFLRGKNIYFLTQLTQEWHQTPIFCHKKQTIKYYFYI